jgi:alkylated DNA nucleotide flippase Atl1
VLTEPKGANYPPGRMLISSPQEIAEVVAGIPRGQVMSMSTLRRTLAERHDADYTCPLTTGIFLRVAAEASDEENGALPYWRVVRDDGRPASSAQLDAGAAWMALALQGTLSGLAVHAMGGFDRERARAAAGLPPGVEPQVAIAVGNPGRTEDLPEKVRALEQPNDRLHCDTVGNYLKPLDAINFIFP